MLFQVPPDPITFETITRFLGFLTALAAIISVGTGVIWYAIRGRSYQELKELVETRGKKNDELKITISEQNARIIALEARVSRIEGDYEDLEKKYLRVRAKLDKYEEGSL